jgi:hypothetical protein
MFIINLHFKSSMKMSIDLKKKNLDTYTAVELDEALAKFDIDFTSVNVSNGTSIIFYNL